MRITYDKSTDAAYIYLTHIPAGGVNQTYSLDDWGIIDGMINLDFDKDKRLIGIEVLDASRQLPLDLLNSIEPDN